MAALAIIGRRTEAWDQVGVGWSKLFLIKTALITGAAKRVGAGLARALAEAGWSVVIHYNSSSEEAKALAETIRTKGGQALTLAADLSQVEETEALIAAARDLAGPLTCLVNNASLFELDRLASLTREGLDQHYAVNLQAPALLSRDFARQLPESEEGVIVNIQDQALHEGGSGFLSYSLCKAGLDLLTRRTAAELAPRIRVNAIAPGYILPGALQSEARFQAVARQSPLGRGGSVEDMAAALMFLVESRSVTGQVIRVDGGLRLAQNPPGNG